MCWRCCRSSRRRIARLGGPPCTYVGHPLIERLGELRPGAGRARPARRAPGAARPARQPAHRDFAADGSRSARRSARSPRRGPTWRCCCPPCRISRGDRGARGAVAGAAADRARRGGEVRGVPARACGARRLRHGDAGARPRRRADGRRLPRRSRRAAPEALPRRVRRSCWPIWCSARMPCPNSSTTTARRRRWRARRSALLADTRRGERSRGAQLDRRCAAGGARRATGRRIVIEAAEHGAGAARCGLTGCVMPD